MKHIIKPLLLSALLGLVSVAQAATARIDQLTTASVGQVLDLQVVIEQAFGGSYAGDELLAFGFTLNYDKSLLQLASVKVSAPWDDDSANLPSLAASGSAMPGITEAAPAGLSLATLQFTVLGTGNALVSVQSDKSDLNQGLIYLAGDTLDFSAQREVLISAVPEPGAYALLMAGLSVLAVARRRRAHAAGQ